MNSVAFLLPLAAALIHLTTGQQCTNQLGGYLRCIKSQLDGDYKGFEFEFRDHFRQKARHCFAKSISEANNKSVCTLFDNELDADAFGVDGPLRRCEICVKIAQFLKGALLSISEPEAACFRRRMSEAIAINMTPCISAKLRRAFRTPQLPDFDAAGFDVRGEIMRTTSTFINAYSRLEFCSSRPDRHDRTAHCLRTPFPGYLRRHCAVINTCTELATPACRRDLVNTEAATCQCIDEKREEIKQRVAKIRQIIQDTLQNQHRGPRIGDCTSAVCQCARGIGQQLATPEVDFKAVLQSSLDECLTKPPPITVDKMLEIGCRRAADLGGEGMRDLRIGFTFIQNVIDSLVERISRFCRGNHCQ